MGPMAGGGALGLWHVGFRTSFPTQSYLELYKLIFNEIFFLKWSKLGNFGFKCPCLDGSDRFVFVWKWVLWQLEVL